MHKRVQLSQQNIATVIRYTDSADLVHFGPNT